MSNSEDISQSISQNRIESTSSTKAPKLGMMIPSRIFVGGIAGNTTEAELRQFFSTFGAIKDCKIISDRAGVSKGYGFVTFVQLEDAEKLVQKEGENHLIFKDRKLNIGPAVRKQQTQMVSAVPQFPQLFELTTPGTIIYANGLPYVLQNGPTTYHLPEVGLPGASPMVAPTYPMILPQQPNMLQTGYYQTTTGHAAAAAAAAASGLQLTGGTMCGHAWPFASANVAMPVVSGSHIPVAAAGQVAVGSGPALDPYIYRVPSVFSGPEVASAHPAGLHYQRIGQMPVIDAIANEGSLITESSIASGHHHHHHHLRHHPYVDMQRLAATALSANTTTNALLTTSVSKENGSILLTNNIQKASTPNHGVKRILSMPQEIVQSPSNSLNIYGLPPVKIFAGQDRRHQIIAQAVVRNSEMQHVPKTQS